MEYSILGLLMTLLFILYDTCFLACPSTYTQTNFILSQHILLSTTTINNEECYDMCASNSDCHSINFYARAKRCELNKASHLSDPVDLVFNKEGDYSVYDGRCVAKCSDRYCSNDTICVMNNQSTTFQCKDCVSPFGMDVNVNVIPKSSITASSTYSNIGHEPWRARLHNVIAPFSSGCWASGSVSVGEYLQVDLGHVVYVTMVATQGRPHQSYNQYVKKYSLAFKNGNNSFVNYEIENHVKIFQGNKDPSTVVNNRLPEKIKTQVIRFVIREWSNHISMRAEIYGCHIPV